MRAVRPLVAFALVSLAACGGGGGSGASRTTTTTAAPSTSVAVTTPPTKTYEHVVWIWMENKSYGQVIGSGAAPYETGLARRFGTATHYADVGRPSLPNYIGATSGSTQGIADDASPFSHALTVDNIFRQVRTHGGTARSYEESMPSNCNLGSADAYAVKHNAAAYYTGGDDRAACNRDDVPFTGTLPSGSLPTFAFVTPNLCDDTHDCSVAAGDAWLKTFVPALLDSAEYKSATTAVFLVWDEATPMPNVIISPTVPAGTVVSTPVDHYSLLRTTEELLGLPLLGKASTATSLRGRFSL